MWKITLLFYGLPACENSIFITCHHRNLASKLATNTVCVQAATFKAHDQGLRGLQRLCKARTDINVTINVLMLSYKYLSLGEVVVYYQQINSSHFNTAVLYKLLIL